MPFWHDSLRHLPAHPHVSWSAHDTAIQLYNRVWGLQGPCQSPAPAKPFSEGVLWSALAEQNPPRWTRPTPGRRALLLMASGSAWQVPDGDSAPLEEHQSTEKHPIMTRATAIKKNQISWDCLKRDKRKQAFLSLWLLRFPALSTTGSLGQAPDLCSLAVRKARSSGSWVPTGTESFMLPNSRILSCGEWTLQRSLIWRHLGNSSNN